MGLFLPLMAVADDWYKGGTLHEAKGYEWIAKDYADQIATSADFLASLKAANSMSQLRMRSISLNRCINEIASDHSFMNMSVKDITVLCVVELGYK